MGRPKEEQPPSPTHHCRQNWGLTLYPNTTEQLNLTEINPRKRNYHIHQINTYQPPD